MVNKILITIPSFNQPSLMKRCLDSLNNQTNKNFSVLIKDDASDHHYSKKYKELTSNYKNLEISYIYNNTNMGAINNMLSCIFFETDCEFIMSLHEDDFIHPQYIEYSLKILNGDSSVAFVASPPLIFDDFNIPKYSNNLKFDWKKLSLNHFLELVINKNYFSFGSVIYRKNILDKKFADTKTYDVLFDRPFLLNILKNSNQYAGIFNDSFYFYQNHPYPDNRWKSLSFSNIINLYSYYRNINPKIKGFITSSYLFSFVNLKNKSFSDYINFFYRGFKNDLLKIDMISFKFLFASIFIFIFGQKCYSKVLILIKKYKYKNNL